MYPIAADECDAAGQANPFQMEGVGPIAGAPPAMTYEPPAPPKPLPGFEEDAEYDSKVAELRQAIADMEENNALLDESIEELESSLEEGADCSDPPVPGEDDVQPKDALESQRLLREEGQMTVDQLRDQLYKLEFCYICHGNRTTETDTDRYTFVNTIEAYTREVYRYGPARIYEQIGLYYRTHIELLVQIPWPTSAVRRHFTRHVHNPMIDRFQMLDTLRGVERELCKRALTSGGDVLLNSAKTLLAVIRQRDVMLRVLEDQDGTKETGVAKRRRKC